MDFKHIDRTQLLLNIFLAIGSIIVIFPFVWMLSLSLKPESEIYLPHIQFIPTSFDFENYLEALDFGETGKFIRNGLIVTFSVLGLQLLTVIPAAYVLAKKNFRFNRIGFGVVLLALMIPQQVVVIPLLLVVAKLNLLNTLLALIIPFVTSSLGIFLLRQNFKQIPNELIDAARIDGASEIYTLCFILVPLIKPAIAAFSVFSIVYHWNDFLWPLLVVNDLSLATPPLGVAIFASDEGGNDVGPMMASAVMIVLPLLMLFFFARKSFIQGINMSGIK